MKLVCFKSTFKLLLIKFLTLKLFNVLKLFFSFFKNFFECFNLLLSLLILKSRCSRDNLLGQRLSCLIEVRKNIIVGSTFDQASNRVSPSIVLFVFVSTSSEHTALFLDQSCLSTNEAGKSKFMLEDHQALRVKVCLLTNSEGAHEFIDTLGFLALALAYPCIVDIRLYMDLISASNEGTSSCRSFKESWHHPRLVRPFPKSSLEKYIKFI